MVQPQPDDNLPPQALVNYLASSIAHKLPFALEPLLRTLQHHPSGTGLSLDCRVSLFNPYDGTCQLSEPLTSIDITPLITPRPPNLSTYACIDAPDAYPSPVSSVTNGQACAAMPSALNLAPSGGKPSKKGLKRKASTSAGGRYPQPVPSQHEISHETLPDVQAPFVNECGASSTETALDKLLKGIWQALFAGVQFDPRDLSGMAQTIAEYRDLRLLSSPENNNDAVSGNTTIDARGSFGRINMIVRKVGEISRVCRAAEVSVQARWVQCFDDRVQTLALTQPMDTAKKRAMSEACTDLGWTEKELRNKMCIWRRYKDIAHYGGYAALVFAGPGLYRFCKYRLSSDDRTFERLRDLRSSFELTADILHPRWRQVLDFLGFSQQRTYAGHLHDWVLSGPGNEPVSLASTYFKWDSNFSYRHIHESIIDEDAWGDYDPRTVDPPTSLAAQTCMICREHQSNDSVENRCLCFPTIYGSFLPKLPPVQIAQTFTGKNNGLFACLPFDQGEAVGEFVGRITTGVSGLDVMFDKTDKASYQIWQGEEGNHTRFINHSCKPNAQYEHFHWLGTQRIVLVSQGIEAGDEITVDYSDTYWQASIEQCLTVTSIED